MGRLVHRSVVVFDWDGTLADSIPAITEALVLAGTDIGITIDPQKARYIIGLGIRDAAKVLLPEGMTESRLMEYAQAYRQRYEKAQREIRLFPGVRDMLAEIHSMGAQMAVATGKSRAGLRSIFDITDTGHWFSASRTADETNPKPAPDMLLELASELSCSPEDLVMIGDTIHDMGMAQAAGAQAIAVTYGAHSYTELSRFPVRAVHSGIPDLIIEVKNFILRQK